MRRKVTASDVPPGTDPQVAKLSVWLANQLIAFENIKEHLGPTVDNEEMWPAYGPLRALTSGSQTTSSGICQCQRFRLSWNGCQSSATRRPKRSRMLTVF